MNRKRYPHTDLHGSGLGAGPPHAGRAAVSPPDPTFTANAIRELAQLEALVAAMRVRLAELQRDVADAEGRLDSNQSAQIVEANEQLVVAAMRSRTDADTASVALEEASRSAQLDALTGLPNRVVLLDRLAHAIPSARRRGARLGLLFLDLNNFKQINDTLGHAAGDEVLRQVAGRLAGAVREGDTVSRLGGDEFVCLLAEVTQASDAVLVADKLIAALAVPSLVDDHVLRLTASIGISLYPDDGVDATTLLERADTAMYRAKRQGLGSVVFHDASSRAAENPNVPRLASLRRPLTSLQSALTEHERLIEQLREANEQLLVAALSAHELHEAAQLALQRQTRFLAQAAHELRSPLAPISTAVAVMRRLGITGPKLPQMQSIIERQVGHLKRLIGDLIDVSRAGTGKLRLDRLEVDIVEVIDAAIEASRPAMDLRLQHLVVRVPSCALRLHGDPFRLSQVLSNLLDNASKYTPEGGKVELFVDRTDDAIVLTISDSGVGIEAEALPHVFEPFMQTAHAIGVDSTGLGLGLAVVRELVEAHGGHVVATSAGAGLGSQFVVTLPLSGTGGAA